LAIRLRRISGRLRLALILCSVVLAVGVWALGLGGRISGYLSGLGILGAVVAGFFYSSGITTPFALLALKDLLASGNGLIVATVAALSAALADSLMLSSGEGLIGKRRLSSLRKRMGRFSFLLVFLGFLVFGSPAPDEAGIALMGLAGIGRMRFFAIVFLAKFVTLLGILIVLIRT